MLDGPSFRYQLRKGEADGWNTAKARPLPEIAHQELALRADGMLSPDEGEPGECTYMSLGAGLNRAQASVADPPSQLAWTTAPFGGDVDLLGYLELRLDATASASDTGWIVTLQDLGPDENGIDVTSGYLRASLREVDTAASVTGQPSLPCRTPLHQQHRCCSQELCVDWMRCHPVTGDALATSRHEAEGRISAAGHARGCLG